jgi:hypothetical protein
MTAFSTKARIHWRKATIVAPAALVGALVLSAPPVAADQASPCPDGFVPIASALVSNGDKKDKNGNGIVCVKLSDGKIVGGPDDDVIL